MNYEEKYLKYKKKYLNLKNILSGGYYIRKNKSNKAQELNNEITETKEYININKDKLINIISKLQDTKEENIKNKIIIAERDEEIENLNKKFNKLKEIYILNEKLSAIEYNGYK